MKKIGILTFHSANNYGAVLQAMSLQNQLLNVGAEVSIINYRPKFIQDEYAILSHKKLTVKNRILDLAKVPDGIRRNVLFEKFRRVSLHETEKIHCAEDMQNLCKSYERIIVGSDQIWNFDITKGDCCYFLDCVDKPLKKFSYAASTGDYEFSKDEAERIKNLLADFDGITVREDKTRILLGEKMRIPDVMTVLDPVFLTDRDEWLMLAKKPKEDHYILYFQMGVSPKANPSIEFAKKLSEENGIPLLYISDQERWYKHRDIKHVGVVDPAQFLGYIANAKYVVTNSFHATAFSIILNVPFFVEINIARSDRIKNLLTMFKLEQRGLKSGVLEKDYGMIDWCQVNHVIDDHKRKAFQFLKTIAWD